MVMTCAEPAYPWTNRIGWSRACSDQNDEGGELCSPNHVENAVQEHRLARAEKVRVRAVCQACIVCGLTGWPNPRWRLANVLQRSTAAGRQDDLDPIGRRLVTGLGCANLR